MRNASVISISPKISSQTPRITARLTRLSPGTDSTIRPARMLSNPITAVQPRWGSPRCDSAVKMSITPLTIQ